MHTTVERDEFVKALELVARVSTKHVTLPVLQCVVIKASENTIKFSATNLEIGIEAAINAKVTDEGVVAVPAATLTQIVNLSNQKEITLSMEEEVLVVEAGKAKTNIKTINSDEFPSIPKIESSGQKINGSLFSLGIKTSAFAASQSSIKPELGSINIFQKKEHTLTFVATDSFRLMEKTVPQQGVVLDDALLIPYKNALELARVCDSVGTDPELLMNENQCALHFQERVYITTRLVSGSFPDYEQIIPKEYVTHATVLKNDLTQTFRRSQIFLNKFMQVSLHVSEGDVTVASHSNEVGATTESIKATTEGDDLALNFNQRYVNESLSHMADDSITMHFAGIGRPMVITGVSDSSIRYLVMPMNK